jgi:hypothetical protein
MMWRRKRLTTKLVKVKIPPLMDPHTILVPVVLVVPSRLVLRDRTGTSRVMLIQRHHNLTKSRHLDA